MEILDDGQRLQMDDGSIWMISPGDIPTVCTWIPTATVSIRESSGDRMFPYVLTNEGIDVSVNAMKVS
jgi:hypothetical protein